MIVSGERAKKGDANKVERIHGTHTRKMGVDCRRSMRLNHIKMTYGYLLSKFNQNLLDFCY